MINKLLSIWVVLLCLVACEGRVAQCENAGETLRGWSGSIRIDSMFLDWRNHAHAVVNVKGDRLLYYEGDFLILPEIGDSLYKAKGSEEYVLVKSDVTYVQKWDCIKDKAVIVRAWKTP